MVATTEDVPKFMGIPMKIVSLATLTIQNSALILIMHYSRVMPTTSGNRYFASTAVLINEVLKLVFCLAVALRDRRKHDGSMSSFSMTFKNLYLDIFRPDSWKLAIPACLYTLQNTLQYVAVSNLDAAAFQVTYQLKILTTALFSVTMLHRRLSITKWISLLTLTAGVAIVQLPSQSISPKGTHNHRRSATYEGIHGDDPHLVEPVMNRSVGLLAVVLACVLSGLAGVYFEKVLKGSNTSLWIRNVQLSFYSLFPALFIGVVLMDGREILRRGFFDGYNGIVWTAVVFQAFGGIIVALCVNFADNIAKNFATSISISISCIASVYFFNYVVSLNFVLGSLIVLFATWLYSKSEAPIRTENVEYVPLSQTKVEKSIEEDGVALEKKDHEY